MSRPRLGGDAFLGGTPCKAGFFKGGFSPSQTKLSDGIMAQGFTLLFDALHIGIETP